MAYTAGQPFTVTVETTPNDQTLSYAVEDTPPAGWGVSGISDGGVFDAVHGKVKWGPFFDNTPRTLTYTLTPPDPSSGPASFAGTASFDGNNEIVAGDRMTAPCDGLVVQNVTITDYQVFSACGELDAGPAVDVVSGGDLTLRSNQRVVLRNGVHIGPGCKLTIQLGP